MYLKIFNIQNNHQHVNIPITKIITAMSLPLFVPERDKGPQSPPLYPRKKKWMTIQ